MHNEIKLPPHSIEAEQSVLGSLMLSDCWDKVATILGEEDFYRAEHKLIWRHIKRIADQGNPVDILTVASSIESTGKLDKLGGLKFLGDIASSVPAVANIVHYAKIIKNASLERRLLTASITLAELVHGQGEINEKIEKAIDAVQSLVEIASDDPVELTKTLAVALETIERRYESQNEISGLKTHFKQFDERTSGLQRGDLIIVAARPSMGKTSFSMNISENMAMDCKKVLVFSLEMGAEQLARRHIASIGKINIGRLRSGRLHDDDWPRLTTSLSKLNDAKIFIDDYSGITPSQMLAKARKLKRKHGLDLIIIDYLQLIKSNNGRTKSEEIGDITRDLKHMAKSLDVPVICLSQLNRNLESRPNKRPVMADLRESGSIEQDADLICFLYRDEVYNPDTANKGIAELITAKFRDGNPGTDLLQFYNECARFEDFKGELIMEKPNRSRGFYYD